MSNRHSARESSGRLEFENHDRTWKVDDFHVEVVKVASKSSGGNISSFDRTFSRIAHFYTTVVWFRFALSLACRLGMK